MHLNRQITSWLCMLSHNQQWQNLKKVIHSLNALPSQTRSSLREEAGKMNGTSLTPLILIKVVQWMTSLISNSKMTTFRKLSQPSWTGSRAKLAIKILSFIKMLLTMFRVRKKLSPSLWDSWFIMLEIYINHFMLHQELIVTILRVMPVVTTSTCHQWMESLIFTLFGTLCSTNLPEELH